MWLSLAFLSAFFLGLYDVAKKSSLTGNAVVPVLFFTTVFNFVLLSPLLLLSWFAPSLLVDTPFFIPEQNLSTHLLYLLKAVIVLLSWLCAYFAMKHLPLTITAPIKATQPVLVLVGALLIFSEQLNIYQWIGVLLAISSFYFLSRVGKKEGIVFKSNKWIAFIVLATVFGAISGLYDKYLLRELNPIAVQFYYNFYQLLIMCVIMALLWYPQRSESTPFSWRWAILAISLFLTLADFVYFWSLSFEGSLISVVSMIRRGGVVVAFFGGAMIFGEKNLKSKALDLILVLIGMLFLYLGSR